MKKKLQALDSILNRDSWIFLAALFFITSTFTISYDANFNTYILLLPLAIVTFSPVLLFTWFRSQIKLEKPTQKYRLMWLAAFIIFPGLGIFFHFMTSVSLISHWPVSPDFFLITGAVFLFLEALLITNRYFDKQIKRIQWIRNIDVDKLLLGFTIFLGLIFGGLATSNLNNPPGERSLYDPIQLGEIITHPFSFISYSAQYMIAFGTLFVFFLINRHLLIGKLLKERGIIIFALGFIATFSILFPVFGILLAYLPISQDFSLLPSGNQEIIQEANFLTPAVFMLGTTPVIIILEWFGQNHKITHLAKEKAEKELDFLKQQINPHFFFNTLNNLYALSLQKSKQTPEVVMQLADLMRYVIYKGKEEYVTIGEELEYIQDYIQLQRLRYHNQLDFKMTNNIDDPTIPIPPLLLIVLVENAFKHGVECAENDCFVHIRISNRDDDIYFEIANSLEHDESSSSGIGLQNLKRRLELIYPKMYDLDLQADYSIFKANLNLYAA